MPETLPITSVDPRNGTFADPIKICSAIANAARLIAVSASPADHFLIVPNTVSYTHLRAHETS